MSSKNFFENHFRKTRPLAKCNFVLLTAILAVSGCANVSKPESDFHSNFAALKAATQNQDLNELSLGNENDQGRLETQEFSSMIQEGQLRGISLATEEFKFSDVELVSFSAEDMALGEFINYVLANILKVNFVLDPKLSNLSKQLVTLNVETEVSKQEFYEIFKETLIGHDISVVTKEGLFFVYKAANRGHFDKIRVGVGKELNDVPEGEIIYQLVPLTFVRPDALKSLVTQVTLATANPLGEGSYVIVQGLRNDVLRALKVIEYLDVPAAVGKHITFFSLSYVEPFEFITQLEELLMIEGINYGVNLKVTALPRHGGVVVHSSEPILIERVRFWKDKLDTSEATGKQRYLLYFPENSKASELASGLGQLLALNGDGTASSSSSARESGESGSSSQRAKGASKSSFASDEIAMVADDNRNALIFYTSPAKYRSLLPIIKQLDVLPAQVMIEAKFIEVTLTDKFSNGVEWALQNALNVGATDAFVGFNNGSFAYNISGLDYRFALDFLQQNEQIKVLSSPRLLVTDGKSANINVGTEVPVLTTQSNDVDTDRVLQSVQYRSTGVDLSVAPTVNSKGIISLELTQSVSETSENGSSGLDSPLILNRSLTTEVFAKSGETIILGGLIRENNSANDKKLPLLGDIPILGRLFNGKSNSTTRTELIIVLTPVIVDSSDGLEEVSEIFKNELRLLN